MRQAFYVYKKEVKRELNVTVDKLSLFYFSEITYLEIKFDRKHMFRCHRDTVQKANIMFQATEVTDGVGVQVPHFAQLL